MRGVVNFQDLQLFTLLHSGGVTEIVYYATKNIRRFAYGFRSFAAEVSNNELPITERNMKFWRYKIFVNYRPYD